MPYTAHAPILRRKLTAPVAPADPATVTVEDLLAVSMPRVADDMFGLSVRVAGIVLETAEIGDLISKLSAGDLIYALKSPDASGGFCVLGPGLLAALIEVQLTGAVGSLAISERVPTLTDGLMAGEIVDRWMAAAEAAAQAADAEKLLPFVGAARRTGVIDIRAVRLMADPGRYRVLQVSLDLDAGAKRGTLTFVTPHQPAVPGGPMRRNHSHDLALHLRETPVKLTAVLARLELGLEMASSLGVDDIVPVPASALENVRIESDAGDEIAVARLGQFRGFRAVRLLAHGSNGGDGTAPDDLPMLGGGRPGTPPEAMSGLLVEAAGGLTGADDGLPPVGLSGQPDTLAEAPAGLPDLPTGLPDLTRGLPGFPAGLPDLPEGPADLPGDLPDLPGLSQHGGPL